MDRLFILLKFKHVNVIHEKYIVRSCILAHISTDYLLCKSFEFAEQYSSITIDRGLGVEVGADPFTLLPRAYFNMGTNARIGKHDRVVITVNKNSTIITDENLNYEAEYNNEGKLIHEIVAGKFKLKILLKTGLEPEQCI